MLKPDFTKYSLALIDGNKIIFSSIDSGLRPLIKCINQHQTKVNNCTLHDKVIGLAAAKLIVYSGMVSSVFAKTASKPAEKYLKENKITLSAENIVDNILTKDKKNICPMELKAQNADAEDFFLE